MRFSSCVFGRTFLLQYLVSRACTFHMTEKSDSSDYDGLSDGVAQTPNDWELAALFDLVRS